MAEDLLKVEGLKQYYPASSGLFGKKTYVKAVDDVDFEVKKGEVFGIVGESPDAENPLSERLSASSLSPQTEKLFWTGRISGAMTAKK